MTWSSLLGDIWPRKASHCLKVSDRPHLLPRPAGIIIMSKAFRRELEAGMQTTHGMRCRNRAQQKRRRRRRREMSSASGVSPGSSSGQSNSDQDLSGCSLTSEDHSADELPSVGHLVSSRFVHLLFLPFREPRAHWVHSHICHRNVLFHRLVGIR